MVLETIELYGSWDNIMDIQRIHLELSDNTKEALKSSFNKVISFLEKGGSLNTRVLHDLEKNLSTVVAEHKQLISILGKIAIGNEFYHVNLCHPDAEILNLSWGIAIDPISQRPLNQIPQIFLSKNSRTTEPKVLHPTSGPLKILIMISSPKDLAIEGRLNFEEEERQIIKAFEPLFNSGEVQVDFTDDGSLDALHRKIDQNNYHILHFSGHGYFDEDKGRGFLLLEDSLSLRKKPATALEFAETLLKPEHTISLVVLSSCQTAQARFEKGIAGITGTLLQKGIPAVVSMGLSIRDTYATVFAAHFYQRIANKKSLPEAFASARQKIKEEEAEEIRRSNLKMLPLQWIIPNLYLTDDVELVDWGKPFEMLKPENSRLIFANTTMEKSGVATDIFVGRREDFARIMPALSEKGPIMLKGQGGIGKTTMAKKLIQRVKVHQPNLIPFIFNEEGKEFSLNAMLEQLKEFSLLHNKKGWLDSLPHFKDNIVKQITFLLKKIADGFPTLLLFDNMESFQSLKTGEFSTDHEATLAMIKYAIQHGQIYTILTGRYPVKELEEELNVFDLNDIDLNDFIRKCYNLGLKKLAQPQMEFCYQVLGGNFRMLEFFHRAFAQRPENMDRVFKDLKSFKSETKKYTEQALQQMAEDLIFDQLWEGINPGERTLARALYHFELPVTELAFHLQGYGDDLYENLARLNDLTLLQVYLNRGINLLYYFTPPLVKNLLQRRGIIEKMPLEFHENAGRYHYYMFSGVHRGHTNDLAAAFWQFHRANNRKKINDLGQRLSGFYYGRSLYANAMGICDAVQKTFGQELPWWCSNRIGMIGLSTGQYDLALPYFKSALDVLEKLPEPAAEDKENKGTTLNNISNIYYARGDYDTALQYLERSLKISQEIGDKSGQIPTLHNMAMIELEKKNIENMFALEMQAYHLALEINDAMGLFQVGQVLGQLLADRGQEKEGMVILRRAYEIGQAAGLPGTEEIKSSLDRLRD